MLTKDSVIHETNRSATKYFYVSLILFVVLFNLLVYFQITDALASKTTVVTNSITDNVALHDGDIVMRNGKGLLTSVFRYSSLQEPLFTHAGFLRSVNQKWFVYHYIDDEINSGLHIQPFSKFIDKGVCSSFAVYRYNINNTEMLRLNSLIASSQSIAKPFDSDFNLDTDSSLYCTEWIAKLCNNATSQNDFIQNTTVGDYKYIAPDNIYLNRHCNLIFRYEY